MFSNQIRRFNRERIHRFRSWFNGACRDDELSNRNGLTGPIVRPDGVPSGATSSHFSFYDLMTLSFRFYGCFKKFRKWIDIIFEPRHFGNRNSGYFNLHRDSWSGTDCLSLKAATKNWPIEIKIIEIINYLRNTFLLILRTYFVRRSFHHKTKKKQ